MGALENKLLELNETLSIFDLNPKNARREYAILLETVAERLEIPESVCEKGNPSQVMETGRGSTLTIEEIGALVVRETGVSLEEISGRRKLSALSAARRLLVYRSVAQGISVGKLAHFLNCSPSAVSKILSRGRKVNKSTPGT